MEPADSPSMFHPDLADPTSQELPAAIQRGNGRSRKPRWLADCVILALLFVLGVGVYLLLLQIDAARGRIFALEADAADPLRRGGKVLDVAATFEQLDRNNDGKITEKEAGNAWGSLQSADKDRDGAVSRQELEVARPRPAWAGKKGGKRKGALKKGDAAKRAAPSVGTVETTRAIFPAHMVEIANDAKIIGVSVKGIHRAYLVDAIRQGDAYVIHDTTGELCTALTYCPKADRVRVFVGPEEKPRRPDIAFGGWDAKPEKSGLLLRARGNLYSQNTLKPADADVADPFPYAELPFVRTTWGKWLEEHPDTHIYVGHVRTNDSAVRVIFPQGDNGVGGLLRSSVYLFPFLPAVMMSLYLAVKLAIVLLRRAVVRTA